ncbi:DNA-dependent protein kinase catalytic subunit [Gigaspora margarita]|uniref:DNA-dependent protein kinase catalytic subunit n=1 Tax=Gigaspora margarita TaxID=4874 RepID=A0A8H3X5E0_GIGMA|nr:DNA-dependent protein kinase catalytic subunit [Gigaspora margarita]
MVRSDSVSLFKILVPIFVRDHDHIYSEEFYCNLGEFVSKLLRSKFVETLEITFGYFMDLKFANVTRNIIQSILKSHIDARSKDFCRGILQKHIIDLINIIEQDKHPRIDSENDDIYSEKGEIVQAYFQGRITKAKELTRIIMDFAHKLNQGVKMCAAYNALAAAILCTQENTAKSAPVFYRTFLFVDKVLKGEYVWENIVDLKVLLFPHDHHVTRIIIRVRR